MDLSFCFRIKQKKEKKLTELTIFFSFFFSKLFLFFVKLE